MRFLRLPSAGNPAQQKGSGSFLENNGGFFESIIAPLVECSRHLYCNFNVRTFAINIRRPYYVGVLYHVSR